MYTLEEILKERLKYGITNTLVIDSYLRNLDNYKMLLRNDTKALFFYIYQDGKRKAQAYIVYGPESHWRFCATYDISCWPKFNEIFTEKRIDIELIDKFIHKI